MSVILLTNKINSIRECRRIILSGNNITMKGLKYISRNEIIIIDK